MDHPTDESITVEVNGKKITIPYKIIVPHETGLVVLRDTENKGQIDPELWNDVIQALERVYEDLEMKPRLRTIVMADRDFDMEYLDEETMATHGWYRSRLTPQAEKMKQSLLKLVEDE